MSDYVISELKHLEKLDHEKKEEELIAKAIQWVHEDGAENWVQFDATINKVIIANINRL